MGEHHAADSASARVEIVVVSDTRTLETDSSGEQIAAFLKGAGHRVVERSIIPDEIEAIARRVELAASRADAVIVSGGTGIARRDVTPEAVLPLLDKVLPGFGETFRRISWDEVGINGVFSRAFAGVLGPCLVFGLPGSRNACRTAMEQLILPMLPHGLGLVSQPR